AAGRLATERRAAPLPHGLPPRRARGGPAGPRGRGGRAERALPQPPQRRAVRLQPPREPGTRPPRNPLGTQPRVVGAVAPFATNIRFLAEQGRPLGIGECI